MIAIVGIGLSSVIAAHGPLVRLAAPRRRRLSDLARLEDVPLGRQVPRGRGPARAPRGGFFLQGVLVALSNPKTLALLRRLLPAIPRSGRPRATQIAIMGLTAMLFAALSDSAHAPCSPAGPESLLTQNRVRLLSKVSGGFLIGGGLWLASSRAS